MQGRLRHCGAGIQLCLDAGRARPGQPGPAAGAASQGVLPIMTLQWESLMDTA